MKRKEAGVGSHFRNEEDKPSTLFFRSRKLDPKEEASSDSNTTLEVNQQGVTAVAHHRSHVYGVDTDSRMSIFPDSTACCRR